MINQVTIVGQITTIGNFDKNRDKYGIINVAVPRAYKNIEGVYETDFVSVEVPKNTMYNCIEFVKKGDIIGIKGRIEGVLENNISNLKIVAEKVTFLSSNNRRVEE